MSASWRTLAILACLLFPCNSGRAGVYVTTQGENPLRDPYPLPTAQDKVKYRLADLVMIDNRAQNPGTDAPKKTLRQEVLTWVETQLEPRLKDGTITLS